MAEDNLPAPQFILSSAQSNWIINELARTENIMAVQVKYKNTWGAHLPDHEVKKMYEIHKSDVDQLRNVYKDAIDNHEWGSPVKRMDEYRRIAELAEQGVCVGVSKEGEPFYKAELKVALDCIRSCKEEQEAILNRDLALLKILMSGNKLPDDQIIATNIPGSVDAEVVNNEENAPRKASTDTDQYFQDDDE